VINFNDMKKLIFILFAIVLLSGCEPMAKQPADITTIPTDVYQALKNDTVPLTMYVYECDNFTYYFNEKKEVTTVYYTGGGIQGADVILMCLLIGVMALLAGSVIGRSLESR